MTVRAGHSGWRRRFSLGKVLSEPLGMKRLERLSKVAGGRAPGHQMTIIDNT
jgi:hypothetical protein